MLRLPSVDEVPSSPPADRATAIPSEPRLTLPSRKGDVTPREKTASADPLPPAFRLLYLSPPPPENKIRLALQKALFALVCVALGVLGSSLLSKPSRTAVSVAGPGTSVEEVKPLTPAEQGELDTAYTALQTHKFADAEQRFEALARRHPNWQAMGVEVGLALFYQGKLDEASKALTAVDKGWMSADANYVLGMIGLKDKDYSEAETNLAKAVTLDPTRPEYYYLWGECLREQGKLLEAAGKFRSALLRNRSETTTGLYRVKLWLSEIEADQENNDGAGAEIDAALALPRPPMEILFAAAARDLKAGNIDAATAHLLGARRRADPKVFQMILRDPVFADVHSRPELAGLFQAEAPADILESDKAATSPASSAMPIGLGPIFQVPTTDFPTKHD